MSETSLDATRHSPGSVGEMIVTAIERHGPRMAFIAGERRVTFHAFGQDVARTIDALTGFGLRRGDAVLQLAANSYELVVVMTACYVGGFVSVTPHYAGSVEDHRHVLEDCQAAVVVADGARAERAQALVADRGLRALALGPGLPLPPLCPPDDPGPPRRLVAVDRPQDIVRRGRRRG